MKFVRHKVIFVRHKMKLRTTSWKWANKRDDFGRLERVSKRRPAGFAANLLIVASQLRARHVRLVVRGHRVCRRRSDHPFELIGKNEYLANVTVSHGQEFDSL